MGSITERAGVKEPAVRQGAAQMIEVVACRPASLMLVGLNDVNDDVNDLRKG